MRTTLGLGTAPPHELSHALEVCVRIAVRGNNNLSQAAARLEDPAKYRLFAATYAAMRVIDDAVDVAFLSRPAEARRETRGAALGLIDRWLAQVEAAAREAFVPDEGSFEPVVFTALNRFLGRSAIALDPWRRLATSLRRDAEERPLETWEDFLSYGEGACVSPGAVFIYILGCETAKGGRTTLSLPLPVDAYARDMAIFCYLVHIVRDLRQDAERNRQLLTIPRSVLAGAGLDADTLAEAVIRGDRRTVLPVVAFLLDEAAERSLRAEEQVVALAPHIRPREHEVLSYLFGLYKRTFGALRSAWL